MSAPTLVVIRHAQVGSHHVQHGEELPPSLLPPEVVGHWLDQDWLKEYDAADRPSLYRLFARFTGAKEQQPLTKEQIASHTLADPPDNRVKNPVPTSRDPLEKERNMARLLRLC